MRSRQKGFTLVEMFLAVTVMVLVVAGALTVYLASYSVWQEASRLAALSRQGSIAMEGMVRGIRGTNEARRNGLREAKAFSIPDAATILFTSGVDNIERRFCLSGGTIIYRCGGGDVIVARDVDSLTFTRIVNKRIRVGLNLQESFKGKLIDISLESEILIRNK